MKWILSFVLLVCLQVKAEEATVVAANNPPAELTVTAPAASATSDSSTSTSISTSADEATKNLKETEIPVHLESTKKAAASESPVLKVILSFSIVGVMGCAAFFLLRKYKFANPKSQATQIKVLSQHYLGPKKSLAIVRVAGESVLIGITDHNISMIKSLSLLDEDIPEETPNDFTTIFSKKTKVTEALNDDPENRDDFSISGIKDFVSTKLKNMRSLE